MNTKLSYTQLEQKYNELLLQNKTQYLLNDSDVIFIQLNTEGVVTHANKKACSVLGYEEAEMVGENWFKKFVPERIQKDLIPISEQILSGEMNSAEYFENPVLTKTGEERQIYWHNSVLKDAEGNVFGHLSSGEDITERKEIEKKLKLTNRVIERSPVIAVIWRDSKTFPVEFMSDNVKHVLGYEVQDFVSGDIRFSDLLHPEDYERAMGELKNRENRAQQSFEHKPYRVKAKNGSYKWIKDTTNFKRDKNGKITHYHGVLVDITKSKNLEIELEQQFAQQQVLFQAFNDGLYQCDSDFKVIYMNNAMENLIGDNAVGEKCYKAIFDLDTPCQDCYFKDLKSGEKTSVDIQYKDKFFKVSAVLLDNMEKVIVYHNITNIKKVKAELVNQNQQLLEAKETAEQSDRLKTEFMNNMSHEIRTPLNGILGFTEFLLDPELTDETRSYYINIIKNSGNQLLHIIEDILEISELGTNQAKLKLEKVCINDLMLELFSVLDSKAKENKTPLYFHKALSDKESTVEIDPTRLHKILKNLIDNALKFTSNGFVEYGYNLKENHLIFYVKDTGIGIDKNDHHSIFERFSQAEKGLSKKVGGLGLGLSIAKENAILLGGEITLESAVDVGSTFFVKLPYTPVYESEIATSSRKAGDKKESHFHILIAEDEEINYLYIEILLQEYLEAKCTVYHAKNGQEAVDMCHSMNSIDLVLMDLKMPVMNGYDATRLIRAEFANLPILAQTAYSTDSDRKKAMDAGCTDVIVKPIQKKEFQELVKLHLFI